MQGELDDALAEQEAKRDEILEVVSRLVQAHHDDASKGDAVLQRTDDVSDLRAAPEILEVDKRYEALVLQVESAKDELCQAEIQLYGTAETFLRKQGLLGPRVSESQDRSEDTLDFISMMAQPAGTPMGDVSETPASETRAFTKKLRKALEQELKRQYEVSRKNLENCQESLDSLREAGDLTSAERALAASSDHALFLAKSQRTRKVVEAEEEYSNVRRRAQEAVIPGLPAKSTDFSDHASDGYSAATVEAHFKLTDTSGIEEWIENETSSKARIVFA